MMEPQSGRTSSHSLLDGLSSYSCYYSGSCPANFTDVAELFDGRWNRDFRSSPPAPRGDDEHGQHNLRSQAAGAEENGEGDVVRYYRGNEPYQRPIGSMRYGIKVAGKYEDCGGDNNKWLGPSTPPGSPARTESAEGEWPVAYHGTNEVYLRGILLNGFRPDFGDWFIYGHGIYCSPSPQVALDYAAEYEWDEKIFKMILQCRVDPARLQKVATDYDEPHDEYWLVPGTAHIRPYGVCIYELEEVAEEDSLMGGRFMRLSEN